MTYIIDPFEKHRKPEEPKGYDALLADAIEESRSPYARKIIKGIILAVLAVTVGLLIWTVNLSTSPAKASDQKIVAATRANLESQGINIRTVEIADGRKNGGFRVLIISYAVGSPARDLDELCNVLCAAHTANKTMKADLDDSTAFVEDRAGTLRAIVNASAAMLRLYKNGQSDREGFMMGWDIRRVDKTFLQSYAIMYNWH
ncbi:MAG: hypothetical protein GY765_31755 [bacterium]|nr:hypothetical protein [bacterium]